jgi:hypothetical protein
MIKNYEIKDERRTNRFTSYLSCSEYNIVREEFEKSTIDNFSQFLRHQLLLSFSEEAKIAIVVPEINKELAKTLTSGVYSLNRLIAQMESDALHYQEQSETDKLNALKIIIKNVKEVDESLWTLSHFFRGEVDKKQVIKNMVYVTLTSDDLIEMAATMISEEESY